MRATGLIYAADYVDFELWRHAGENDPATVEIMIPPNVTFPLAKGTVMGKITEVGNAYKGYFIPYLVGAADGSEIARGILMDPIDAEQLNSTTYAVQGTIGIRGTCYEEKCTGLDATAKAALTAIVFV